MLIWNPSKKIPGSLFLAGLLGMACQPWAAGDPKTLNTVINQKFYPGSFVSNGGFENNYSGYPSSLPDVFEKWDVSGLTPIHPSTVRARNGRRLASFQYTSPDAVERAFLRTDFFPVEPAQEYTLFFYYQAASVAGSVMPMVKNYKGRSFAQEAFDMPVGRHGLTPYAGTSGWTLYTHHFTTGPTGVFSTVELLVTDAAGEGGSFYFDDVILLKGNQAPSALDNASSLSLSFLDGMNRPKQKVVPDGNLDLVTETVLDEMGRVERTTLPISKDFQAVNGRHDFVPDVTDTHADEYYSASGPGPDAGGYPYFTKVREPSPLGRETENFMPGEAWNTPGGFGRNPAATPSDRIYYASTPDLAYEGNCVPSGSSQCDGSLPKSFVTENDIIPPYSLGTGKYFYTLTQNEDFMVNREFKDILGRVVKRSALVRSYSLLDENGAIFKTFEPQNYWADTEYGYDLNGNLVSVKAPKGPNNERLTQFKTYNSLGEVVSERMPSEMDAGTGTQLNTETRRIFDRAGRLRFTQTSVQEDAGRFSYVKYDSFGRLVEMGEYLGASAFTQDDADDDGFPDEAAEPTLVVVKGRNFYDQGASGGVSVEAPFLVSENGVPEHPWEYVSLNTAYAAAKSAVLASAAPPQTVIIHQIYTNEGLEVMPDEDEFEYIQHATGTTEIHFQGLLRNSPEYLALMEQAAAANQSGQLAKGRLVKAITYNRDPDAFGLISSKNLVTEFQYDRFGNITEQRETNEYALDAHGRQQRVAYQYDASNRLTKKTIYATAGSSTASSQENVAYDRLGRVADIKDANGANIATFTYNGIGQKTGVSLGSVNPLTESYNYNLQGWRTGYDVSRAGGASSLFQEKLYFESLPLAILPEVRFSGNLSAYEAVYQGGDTHGLNYLYSGVSDALTAAWSYRISGGTPEYGERNSEFRYFDNGSLKSLGRDASDPLSVSLQPLVYYAGNNRLEKLGGTGRIMPGDPRNLGASANFQYDGEGNMTRDLSKQTLRVLQYNERNFPVVFEYPFQGQTYRAVMVYDAKGDRAAKIVYQLGATPALSTLISTTLYTSYGKEIRYVGSGSSLQRTEVTGVADVGRITREGATDYLEFYVKNYLGSTVQVVSEGTGNPVTFQAEYWPYGKEEEEVGSGTDRVSQRYSGKELDEGIGLNYFGARYYDADLGLWITQDPVKEFHNPYAYVGGNPVGYIDPNGLDTWKVLVGMAGTPGEGDHIKVWEEATSAVKYFEKHPDFNPETDEIWVMQVHSRQDMFKALENNPAGPMAGVMYLGHSSEENLYPNMVPGTKNFSLGDMGMATLEWGKKAFFRFCSCNSHEFAKQVNQKHNIPTAGVEGKTQTLDQDGLATGNKVEYKKK